MINKKYFCDLAKTKTHITEEKKYLAYMLLDESKANELFARKLANKYKLNFRNIKGVPVWRKKDIYIFSSPERWLSNIKNAEIIVTDSFHCTVLSVIFHKNFICIATR